MTKIKILDFYATWCNPCKIVSNSIESLPEDLKELVTKINIENEEDLVEQYDIKSVPTLIFLKDEKEVKRHIGSLSEDMLIDYINKIKKLN